MPGDDFAATGDHDRIDVTADQNVVMAIGRRHRVVVRPVTHQRQRGDAGGDFLAGIKDVRRQWHQCLSITYQAIADAFLLAAQDGHFAFLAGVQQSRIQFVDSPHAGQWHHEVAPYVADQAFDLALVVAFGRTAEAIFKQVVALQFAERLGALARSVPKNLGHGDLGVVVENRLQERPPSQVKAVTCPSRKASVVSAG